MSETVCQHRAQAPTVLQCAVITVSDTRTPETDTGGKAVADYLTAAGITITDAMSLGVPDNVKVAQLDPMRLPDLAAQMDLGSADGVIISACVQMPSLPAITAAERQLDLPVLSAATATVHDLLVRLGRPPEVPDAGALLSGSEALAASA